jgi:hypothetical protein
MRHSPQVTFASCWYWNQLLLYYLVVDLMHSEHGTLCASDIRPHLRIMPEDLQARRKRSRPDRRLWKHRLQR